MHVIVHFDGCYSIKDDHGAGAGVAYAADTEERVELGHRAQYLTGASTPVAEYTALICALQLALELGATSVRAWGDAELIIRQVNEQYACRKEHLKPYLRYVHLLLGQFDFAEVLEFPKAGPKMKRRFLNARADEVAGLCRKARTSTKHIEGEHHESRPQPTST